MLNSCVNSEQLTCAIKYAQLSLNHLTDDESSELVVLTGQRFQAVLQIERGLLERKVTNPVVH